MVGHEGFYPLYGVGSSHALLHARALVNVIFSWHVMVIGGYSVQVDRTGCPTDSAGQITIPLQSLYATLVAQFPSVALVISV